MVFFNLGVRIESWTRRVLLFTDLAFKNSSFRPRGSLPKCQGSEAWEKGQKEEQSVRDWHLSSCNSLLKHHHHIFCNSELPHGVRQISFWWGQPPNHSTLTIHILKHTHPPITSMLAPSLKIISVFHLSHPATPMKTWDIVHSFTPHWGRGHLAASVTLSSRQVRIFWASHSFRPRLNTPLPQPALTHHKPHTLAL